MKKIRFIPYGYSVRDGHTVIDHKEAEIIQEIFKEYITGASLKDIAEDLTQRKIPYTEKTDAWDKARVSRIIENAKYLGDGEYDPIIDEATFERASACKAARQNSSDEKELAGISTLRNRVHCEACGSTMMRKVNSQRRIRESWVCSNPECGCRVRISDANLLRKVTILLLRINLNANPACYSCASFLLSRSFLFINHATNPSRLFLRSRHQGDTSSQERERTNHHADLPNSKKQA